jgi:hypothetical protein
MGRYEFSTWSRLVWVLIFLFNLEFNDAILLIVGTILMYREASVLIL